MLIYILNKNSVGHRLFSACWQFGKGKKESLLLSIVIDAVDIVGVLPSGSTRGIPRRVVMSRDSPRSERNGARNTRI